MHQEAIEGHQAANLGFNLSNNGDMVIINVPMLSPKERRKDLCEGCTRRASTARVSIRDARQDQR